MKIFFQLGLRKRREKQVEEVPEIDPLIAEKEKVSSQEDMDWSQGDTEDTDKADKADEENIRQLEEIDRMKNMAASNEMRKAKFTIRTTE